MYLNLHSCCLNLASIFHPFELSENPLKIVKSSSDLYEIWHGSRRDPSDKNVQREIICQNHWRK